MYIESTDELIVGFSCCDDGTTSAHHACILSDRATYRHSAKFDTHAEAAHLVGRIEQAGEIDLDCWSVCEHGIFDTNSDHVGDEPCERCSGSGMYYNRVENGKPKGNGGICYRCAGKGHHDKADRQRNTSHDAHYMARG